MEAKSDVNQLVDEACAMHAALSDECSRMVAAAFAGDRTGQVVRGGMRAFRDKHGARVREILLRFISTDLAAFSDRELKLMVSHIRFFQLICPEVAAELDAWKSPSETVEILPASRIR
jgi:hypothetical protein